MPFTFKLARRLARLRGRALAVPVAALAVVAAVSCELPTRPPASQGAPAVLIVDPDSLTLYQNQTTEFTAVALTDAGDTAAVAVHWTATSGTITDTSTEGGRHRGRYRAGSDTGKFRVVARGNPNGPADTAVVAVALAPVAGVAVSPAVAGVTVGQTVQLGATLQDAGGNPLTGRTVTWASSDPGVATVSGGGLVTGAGVGSATVTATSEGQSGSAGITVTLAPVASVTVSPAAASVVTGRTVQLSATLRDANGIVLTGRTVTWTTSDAGLATVDGGGLVSAGGLGTVSITASSEGRSGSATVTVVSVPVAAVTVSPATASLLVGATAQLGAVTTDSAGNVLTGRPIVWASSNAAVATVSGAGLVTARAAGSATISATSEGKSGSAAIAVANVPVASVTVSPATASLLVGQTAQLAAATKDSAGTVLTGRTVTWTSSNTAVATVSGAGLVTAKAAGSATITATSEGQSGTAAVGVANVPVASVTVTPATASVAVGATVQLAAATRDSAGNTLTGRTVAWASSNTAVATVSPTGLVAGVTAGSATITATSEGKSGSAAVTVTAPPPPGTRAGYYVTTTGTSGGDGTAGRPWDLRTALSGAGGRIRPGDTVWVRGGTYTGSFTTSLTGTASAPIVVRAYPGERAIIDGNGSTNSTFVVDGAWAVYWGLEIMNSMTARSGSGLGLRPTGVYIRNCDNVKLINLIVHDTGHGTYTEYGAENIEIYGWIIFNGGHQNSTRSDGHGIYIKNNGPALKTVRDNVVFNQFGFGVHGYSEGSGALKYMVFEGNVLFNNGELSNDDNPNLQIGGELVADNNVVADNMTYFSPGHGFWNLRLGYQTVLNGSTVVRNNYVVGGGEMVEVGYWQNLDWIGNTFVGDGSMIRLNDPSAGGQGWSGNMHFRDPAASAWRFGGAWRTFAGWQQASGLGATDQASSGKPAVNQVVVRPNQYEPGRATVVVYNWTRQGSVGVDLGGVVPIGYVYEVRNVQQIFGAPVASGTFGGGTIQIPMGGVTAQAPIGGSPNAPLRTGPDFDVFVVTSRAP